jgi:adenylate cyclase
MAVRWAWLRDVARKHRAGFVAGLATVLLITFGFLDGLEHWSLSQLFERRGERAPAAPIVIVTIDESTFAELNTQWPFPRAMHAELLTRIAAGGPLAVGVDVIFDTPSSRGAADDAALGAAVARAGTVVLGAAAAEEIQPFYRRHTLNPPIPVIRQGAAGVAPVNMYPDPDGTIRRVPLWLTLGDARIAAFDAQLHALA